MKKKSPAVESSTWPLNSHNCSEKYTKAKNKTKLGDQCSSFDIRRMLSTVTTVRGVERLPLSITPTANEFSIMICIDLVTGVDNPPTPLKGLLVTSVENTPTSLKGLKSSLMTANLGQKFMH